MYLTIFFIFLIATTLAFASVTIPNNGLDKIIGGRFARKGEFPYLVSLQTRTANNGYWYFCGGSLISPEWVITAAHCPLSVEPGASILVRAGKHLITEREATEQVRAVVKWIVHEDYYRARSEAGQPNDIALMRLQSPFLSTAFIQPIQLPNVRFPNDVRSNQEVIVSGWGAALYFIWGQWYPGTLKTATQRTVDLNSCNASVHNSDRRVKIHDSQICTAPIGGIAPCVGDSGGPLTSAGEPKVILGIVSYGYCGLLGVPTVYTRVSSYLDWITAVIANNS